MNRTLRRSLFTAAGVLAVVAAAVFVSAVWYERGRGLDREVERLAAVAEVRAGSVVADIGAGTGRVSARVAARVGASGRVYATEVQAALLPRITANAAAIGVANVAAIAAGEHRTGLPDGCCDVVYMRHVYHHLSDPEAINRGVYAALRPGGRYVVIDFISPQWIPFWRHGIPAETVRRQVATAGFQPDVTIERWSPIAYCLVFRKPAPAVAV